MMRATRLAEDGRLVYPYSVHLEADGSLYPLHNRDNREIVRQLLVKNCQQNWQIGDLYMVSFKHEDDAALFVLAFS